MEASDHRWVRAWFITDPICIVFFVVMCLYYVVLEARFGVTLGKLALRIRVIEISSGGVPGWRRSMIRNALRLVDGLPALNLIGVILILATPEKTRLGDLVAQTRVVINQR